MTNITLSNPQDYVQNVQENQIVRPLMKAVRSFFIAADSEIDTKTNFLQAWEMTNNGQG